MRPTATTTPISHGMIPPQATEVEEVLLAGLMTDREAYGRTATIIDQGSFYKESNRIVYETIQNLVKKNKPTDLVMVTQELRNAGRLEEVGGPLAITLMTNKSALAYNIEHHARIIAQKFIQRELIRIGMETVQAGFDDTIDIEDQLTSLKSKLDGVENIGVSTHTGKTQIETLSGAIQEIELDCQNVKEGKAAGISTGLTLLDHMTGGWRKTNLIILAARPGIGKTSLALHFTKKAASAGEWVNFYGLEMTSEDLMRIMIASECDVVRSNIRDGRLADEEWIQINNAASRLESLNILWYDSAGITAGQIRANTKRNAKRGKCGMVVIDYLQLMTPTDKKAPREQQVSEITRSLKGLALEVRIPIICLAQLNREASEGEPQLHHLRESGAIEQDADVVLMPWRDTENNYKLSIPKNRRGSVGKLTITANDEMTRFSNAPYRNQQSQTPSPAAPIQYPVPGPDNRIQSINEIPF